MIEAVDPDGKRYYFDQNVISYIAECYKFDMADLKELQFSDALALETSQFLHLHGKVQRSNNWSEIRSEIKRHKVFHALTKYNLVLRENERITEEELSWLLCAYSWFWGRIRKQNEKLWLAYFHNFGGSRKEYDSLLRLLEEIKNELQRKRDGDSDDDKLMKRILTGAVNDEIERKKKNAPFFKSLAKYKSREERAKAFSSLSRKEINRKKPKEIVKFIFEHGANQDLNDLEELKKRYVNQKHLGEKALILAELLEYCLYRADKPKETAAKPMSPLIDIAHMVEAIRSNVFVTTDKKLAKRAEAVYSHLKTEGDGNELPEVRRVEIKKNGEKQLVFVE